MDEDLKMHIYKSSHTKSDDYGSPLYLAICKNIYQNLKESGTEPCEEDFSPVFADLVDRLLSYKTKEETDILTVLATLETWTNDFAYNILEKLLIPSFLINYDDALKSEFIKRLDADIASIKAYEEKYIMDKTLSATISHKMGAFFKYKIAQLATDYYLIDAKNSLGKTKDYIKWKLRMLDEDEIMPFFEKEFEDFEAGPLKDLDDGMRSSFFLKKFILDMFIDEVKSLKVMWQLVNERVKFYKSYKIKDYISAADEYDVLFDISKELSSDDLKDNAKNTKDIFGFSLSFSTKENMLYEIKESKAKLYKEMNETDKAYEAYKQGLDVYESPSFEQVRKAKFFSDFVKDMKDDKYYELALNKELEIIYALYNKDRGEEDDEDKYLDLLFRVSEIYGELENYEKAIDEIKRIIDIRQEQIKNDTEEENQKAYYYEKLIETYTKLAELLNEAQREDEANQYWHKIINEGLDVLKQKLHYKETLIEKSEDSERVIEENLGVDINESLMKAGLALYKSSKYIDVFEVYKKVFSNEYKYRDANIEKSAIRFMFSEEWEKKDYFEKLLDVLLEKDEAKKYEKEVNELVATVIKARYEEKDDDDSKLDFKVSILKIQRDFYEKADNLAKAIEITKEIISIKEGNKDAFKSVESDFETLIKLLEKAGEKDEALKLTLKLEELEYTDGLKKLDYIESWKIYDKFKESGKLELYTKFFEDFCEKVRRDADSQPIQILFTLNKKLKAFTNLDDANKKEKAYNELLKFYKENYYGTTKEKIDNLISEASVLGIYSTDVLSVLEDFCKLIYRFSDDIGTISCEDITNVLVDRAFYAILSKGTEIEAQKIDQINWTTRKPWYEIRDLYEYAYKHEDEKEKEKILEGWDKRADEIKDGYGEKSYENFFAKCYSLLAIFYNNANDKNLSNFLAFLDEAKDFMDEQELISAKEDMLRSCKYILKDQDFMTQYDEVYKHSVDTKGAKASGSIDILLDYARELKRKGLNEKALELLKNVDDLGDSYENKELKAIKEEIQKKLTE